jgi:hypothetical protein
MSCKGNIFLGAASRYEELTTGKAMGTALFVTGSDSIYSFILFNHSIIKSLNQSLR